MAIATVATETSEHEPRAWAATAAATVGLALGPSTVLVFLFGVFIEPLSQAHGWSKPAIVLAATILSLSIMIVSPIQGCLIDRFGARPLALVSCLSFAAGLFAMGYLPDNILFFYILYGALPLLAIGLWPVSYMRVISTWFERRLGLAIGIANGGIGLGAAVLPLVISLLISNGSLRLAYIFLGAAVLLIVLPLNLFFLKDAPPAKIRVVKTTTGEGAKFRDTVLTPGFASLAAAFLFLGFVNTGLVTNQMSLLIDSGATPQNAALVLSVFGISVLLGRFLTGVLLDHVSAKGLMSIVCLGGAVACTLYAVGPAGGLWYLCAILIGAVYGAEFDVLGYLVKRYFAFAAFGRVYGSIFAIFQLGAAIGATVLPLSKARLESYVPGLLTYAAALAISAVLILTLHVARPRAVGD